MTLAKAEILWVLFSKMLLNATSIWENGLLVRPLGLKPKTDRVKTWN
jgi:hypothetical protein